ncbi:hypothetical protein AB0942_32575 [Streptomyces nodosus]|uniref:hypothetical protein n=1 Tax=Streptomyces nodosus TaxID=40318 RepID=UPI003452EDB2
MPSVVGLLEDRERAARQRVEGLREEADRVLAELRDAELFWERFVTAREVLAEVLAGPGDGADVEEAVVPATEKTAPTAGGGAVPGAMVPVWHEGLEVSVLSPDYQRITGDPGRLGNSVDLQGDYLDARAGAGAGAGRGSAVEGEPAGEAGLVRQGTVGAVHTRAGTARRRVMSMVIDQ